MADLNEQMRREFEAWLGRPLMNPQQPSHYNGRDVRTAWEAWQEAARRQHGSAAFMVDARVIAQHYAAATLLKNQPDWPGAVVLHFSDNSHAEFAYEVLHTALTAGLIVASASVSQHGSAAQAVERPFGYMVCAKSQDGSDEFIYRQVWDNISPEGRANYVIKTTLFAAPPVADAQGVKPEQVEELSFEWMAASQRQGIAVSDSTRKVYMDGLLAGAALSRSPAAAAEVAAEQPAAEPELSEEWLNAAAVADQAGAPEKAPETTEQMHARAKRALRVLSVARRTSTSGRADRAALGAIADNLAAVLYEVEAIEQHLRAAGQCKDSEPKWEPVTRAGQVKVGDRLRFGLGDKKFSERAKLILHAGTDKEEVIYDKGNNFYFITSMVVNGRSNHKNVEVLAQAMKASAQGAGK